MIMRFHPIKNSRGFSLVELLIAMALGLILLASVTQLFKSGMDASRVVSQRTEMQDDVRAAINMISRDVSLAGSGLPPGGIALPFGPGNSGLSVFAKDQVLKTWMNNNTYPTGVFGPAPGSPVTNYMYGLIPGPLNGMEKGGAIVIPATNQAADAITSTYVDFTFPLNQYVATFADNTGTKINLAIPAPAPVPALPAFINGPGGIQVGDLILLSSSASSAIGEVTNVAATSITFANLDPLNINQTGAASGNILALCAGNPCTSPAVPAMNAYRVNAVTYFVEVPAVAGQLPKLMRQVDGHTPQPIADDVISLKITYDVCDGTITPGVNPNCAGISDLFANGFTPNDVHKVDIAVMGQSILSYGNKAQNMQLTTSVSTRNLTFRDRYQ
jgi:prepilin-type N-terminal cleavage/methylation domain-containing protein